VSFALDVDILLYASDPSSPMHPAALAFLGAVALGDEVCFVPWPTVMGYLCIATHPRIFTSPLSPVDAQGNIDRLLARPHVRSIGEVEGFWEAYPQLARDLPARGHLAPDAHVAAVLGSMASRGSKPATGISPASPSCRSPIRSPIADPPMRDRRRKNPLHFIQGSRWSKEWGPPQRTCFILFVPPAAKA
jgi:toxin-antitoxin system PIN domain toxin